MARTVTSTKTYTRVVFLQFQIRRILRATTQVSDNMLDKLMHSVERQWIEQIDVYALDYNQLCRARLGVSIDWKEHERQVSIGKVTIAVDSRWKDDLLPETDGAIWAFNEYVKKFRLRTEWRVTYADWVRRSSSKLAEARGYLGTSPGKPVKWAGKTAGDTARNRLVPEFGIGLFFVE